MPFIVHSQRHPDIRGELDATIFVLENGTSNRAEIWPALGFNCYRWLTTANGQPLDLLYADPDLFHQGRPTRSGIPILFPFPNRIKAGKYTWDGKDYHLPISDQNLGNSIHGFACRLPWRVVDQGSNANSAWVTGEFHLSADGSAFRDQWPSDARLRLTYRLGIGSLRLEAEVDNPEGKPLPFGLGYHPYFRIPFRTGFKPEDCQVQVPARAFWKLDKAIPTGEVLPVDGNRNLNSPRSFTELNLDDVLTDLPQGAPLDNNLYLRSTLRGAPGLAQLAILCSDSFREMVVYTPGNRQAFCVEPYTCPTDAVNLHNRGQEVGWIVLPPRQKWSGVVDMRVWLE